MPAEPVWFLDTPMELHLDAAATGSEHAPVTRTAEAPGHMPPPHVHVGETRASPCWRGS